jgi:uncharacterized protein (UPF0248 family)
MQPLRELINKIKWDKKENPDDYVFYYEDRKLKKLLPLRFNNIEKIENIFMIVVKENKETYIPMHRVKEVRKKDEVVWKRG